MLFSSNFLETEVIFILQAAAYMYANEGHIILQRAIYIHRFNLSRLCKTLITTSIQHTNAFNQITTFLPLIIQDLLQYMALNYSRILYNFQYQELNRVNESRLLRC